MTRSAPSQPDRRHRFPRGRERRGIALLLALVCLSVASVAGVSLLRVASDARTFERQRSLISAADPLARDAEALALAWLAGGGFERVEEGAALDGFVRITRAGMDDLDVTLDALDLSGRLPVELAGGPLGAALPTALRGRVADMHAASGARTSPPARSARPDAALRPLLRAAIGPVGEFPRADLASPAHSDAACLWLRTGSDGPHSINLRSAPLPLLEAALAGHDPSAAGRVLAARRSGKRIDAGDVAPLNAGSAARGAEAEGPRLTLTSDAAGFLLTVSETRTEASGRTRAAGGRVRFWIVAERDERTNAWRIVERRRAEG